MSDCIACRVRALAADTAFLAGVAYAFSHNNEAIRESLCDAHADALVRGTKAADPKIANEDRRR